MYTGSNTPKRFFYNTLISVIEGLGVAKTLEDYMSRYGLFVTMHVPKYFWMPNGVQDSGDLSFRTFRICYLRFVQDLLGKRYAKKLGLQPFTLAFLDFPGTRRQTGLDLDSLSGLSADRGKGLLDASRHNWVSLRDRPHIHAIMLLHPSTKETFDRLYKVLQRSTAPGTARVRWPVYSPPGTLLHIEPFDPEKGDVKRLLSYASKIGIVTGAGRDLKTFEIYPDCLSPEVYLAKAKEALELALVQTPQTRPSSTTPYCPFKQDSEGSAVLEP